jgi:flagellar hook-associated protein 1 FlgK
MSLSAALNTAMSSLSNTSTQTSIVSKNLSNVGNANYARRSADLTTNAWGAEIAGISRTTDNALFRNNIASIAAASGQNTLLASIEQMRNLSGGNDYETSPSTVITQFYDSLQLYASKPGDPSAAQSAIASAVDVTNNLRDSSAALQKLRKESDDEIARQVDQLNSLLADFEDANNKIKLATRAGADASDSLDRRDALVKKISEIIGITTATRGDNDMALYTTDGATLFESVPRTVSFARTGGFGASTVGQAVLVDGIPVDAGIGGATTAQGSLAALLQVRDTVVPTYQSQLDEMARGLVLAVPALFQYTGTYANVPADGVIMPGLSAALTVNPAMNQNVGGDPFLLRNGPAGYSDQLVAYIDAMDLARPFDPAAQLGESASLIALSASSVGWLEELRSQANQSSENKSAAYFRTSEALSNAVGVNQDEELAKLIELEQSYKATSRIVTVVDEMLRTLLEMTR